MHEARLAIREARTEEKNQKSNFLGTFQTAAASSKSNVAPGGRRGLVNHHRWILASNVSYSAAARHLCLSDFLFSSAGARRKGCQRGSFSSESLLPWAEGNPGQEVVRHAGGVREGQADSGYSGRAARLVRVEEGRRSPEWSEVEGRGAPRALLHLRQLASVMLAAACVQAFRISLRGVGEEFPDSWSCMQDEIAKLRQQETRKTSSPKGTDNPHFWMTERVLDRQGASFDAPMR